jgi:hypothetical protein
MNSASIEQLRPIGRPPLAPSVWEDRRQRVAAALLTPSGGIKNVQAELGICYFTACTWIRAFGFRVMWVSREERRHLLDRRSAAIRRRAA